MYVLREGQSNAKHYEVYSRISGVAGQVVRQFVEKYGEEKFKELNKDVDYLIFGEVINEKTN